MDKKKVYLLGYPLGHSVSPAMQNAVFLTLGMDWEYSSLETESPELRESIARVREGDCAGANVTIPHKQAVIDLLDDLSETARRIHAVNTIVNRDGKLFGDNTDAPAFITSLKEHHIHPRNANVAIIGAGGAARAVTFALAAEGVREIVIINRSGAHAAELADRLHETFPKLEIAVNWVEAVSEAHILVNATPVGMSPNVTDSPMPRGHAELFSLHSIVVDLVYNPIETKFLADANHAGARTIGGLGMLVHQGAAAFKLWTGQDAPVDVMWQAAMQVLNHKT